MRAHFSTHPLKSALMYFILAATAATGGAELIAALQLK